MFVHLLDESDTEVTFTNTNNVGNRFSEQRVEGQGYLF